MNKEFWQEIGFKIMGPIMYSDGSNISSHANIYFVNEIKNLLLGENQDAFSLDEKKIRNDIRACIEAGMDAYEKSGSKGGGNAELQISKLSRRDIRFLKEMPVIHTFNGKNIVVPLTVNGQIKMAIINPWPGDMHAEAEVVKRMHAAAQNIGMRLDTIDRFGRIIECDNASEIGEMINGKEYLFVINTHFDTHKSTDVFYYHTLWNPPELPLSWDRYDVMSDNYLMNDDYLIYGSGSMYDHLKMILFNKPRNTENASMLTASFPENKMLEPDLQDPIMFYCGMNWDVFMNGTGRHDGVFKLLDETGNIKFFGPDMNESWGGIRPWKGYKCYQYPIPFDGFSILEEINKCGVCLVLSSDVHRRACAASSRVYEACAAGAVIISDDNEFVKRHFGDAALFIDYNINDPKDTFNQIMSKYEWVVKNPDKALDLVRRAQDIFRKKFALEKQISDIVRNHERRIKVISEDLFAGNEDKKVLVTFVLNTIEQEYISSMLEPVMNNISNQLYGNITLGIACDMRVSEHVSEIVNDSLLNAVVIPADIFDAKESRHCTDGEAIRIIQKKVDHDLWINMYAHDVWFCDHITTLVKEFDNPDIYAAYSGRLGFDKTRCGRNQLFDVLKRGVVTKTKAPQWLPGPSQIMFSAMCEDEVEDYMMNLMDGYEHYLYLAVCWIHYGHKISFTRRMSFGWRHTRRDNRCVVINEKYQLKLIRDVIKFDKKGRIEDIGDKK